MSGRATHGYEIVLRGPVGPVLAHVLQPCTVERAEVVTVLRVALPGTTFAELVHRLEQRGWVISRVALIA